MKYFGIGLSELHQKLSATIRKPDRFAETKQLFFDLHSRLHLSEISETEPNEVNRLLDDLTPRELRIMPAPKDETIAWVIWHVARIEDLTMGILVGGEKQLFDEDWKRRINVTVTDTGNAMSDNEIMELSRQIDFKQLILYRNAVGQRTREIVKTLSFQDMRRKILPRATEAVLEAGGVTNDENSLWLLDYWGKKDVAGILLMPPTRHVILHFNDCCKWKLQIRNKKRCYREI